MKLCHAPLLRIRRKAWHLIAIITPISPLFLLLLLLWMSLVLNCCCCCCCSSSSSSFKYSKMFAIHHHHQLQYFWHSRSQAKNIFRARLMSRSMMHYHWPDGEILPCEVALCKYFYPLLNLFCLTVLRELRSEFHTRGWIFRSRGCSSSSAPIHGHGSTTGNLRRANGNPEPTEALR